MTQAPNLSQRMRGLYLITADASLDPTRFDQIETMVRSGLPVLQYRRKTVSQSMGIVEAGKLIEICQSGNTLLIINDDLELARKVEAHGVHLGEHDEGIEAARHYLGNKSIIGKSCYSSFETAQAAVAAGADYVAFGSFFPSRTKPTASTASLELLGKAKNQIPVPVIAIGGITLANAGQLIDAGADMVAVLRDTWDQSDPPSQVCNYAGLFE